MKYSLEGTDNNFGKKIFFIYFFKKVLLLNFNISQSLGLKYC